MPVDDRFQVRSARPGDEAGILELFARSFHTARSLASWRWRYENNPWGNCRIGVATTETGALVGHYAGYPVPFVEGARDLLAHQVGDTMTDASIRHIGRGPTSILGRTALHFYETFCEGQIAFNYGFNVANIQRFSLRFLRSDLVEPVTYRKLDAKGVTPISRWERYAGGYQLELVANPGGEYDDFFERVRKSYGFLVRRDARYLRWRYFQSPEGPYFMVAVRKWRRLVGWIVFRVRDGRFVWGDALFDPRHPEAVSVVLRHVLPGYPVALVEGWFAPRPRWFSTILAEIGFVTEDEPQNLSLMCVPFELSDAVERMRTSLYYTWGDSDLF
jgi:hypothetical protein